MHSAKTTARPAPSISRTSYTTIQLHIIIQW